MDPPQLPTPTTTTTTSATATATITPTTIHLNYPDSVESSPRSHTADHYNEPLPSLPGAKLRLMCSYGGHIIPRPHDKALCYVGGETRIIAIDRHSKLSSLVSHLSHGLLNGRSFTLKYQLPTEELDSLVSVTTDEDLDNMIEEYDRITASSLSLAPSRIRLFLFFNKPETVASMGSLLDDAKSETWFVDALNGSLLPKNLSDSATMDCLVNLNSNQDLEAQVDGVEGNGREGKNKQEGLIKNNVTLLYQEVQSAMPDSPMMENGSSSFGSSVSFPSTCNLPPIRVRVEDQRAGTEEQFAHMTFAQKQEDGYGHLATAAAPLPPLPTTVAAVGMVSSLSPAGGSTEHLNRFLSDDERSDQNVPVTFCKKPPLPLQPVQHKASACSYINLPSPDSVASETSSTASVNSFSKQTYHQEYPQSATEDSKPPVNPETTSEVSHPSAQIQVPRAPNPVYTPPKQLDHQQQHQYIQSSTNFSPQPASTPFPISPYYPVYTTQQQHPHQLIDQHQQQYPIYIMPLPAQTQPYMSVQSNLIDTPSVITATSRPPTPNSHTPPLYPAKIPISARHFNKQFMGYTQTPIQHLSQSIVVAPTVTGANYGYEYAKGTSEQLYYSHQIQAADAAPVASQYQSMSPATAVAIADASNQLPTSPAMHQMGTSPSI